MDLATKNSANDTFTIKDMLKQEIHLEVIQAMMQEVNDHESRNHWSFMRHSSLPLGAKTIMSIWFFKRKCFTESQIMKHKARLCAHGGMQKWGIDYWETYFPVVNWISVCFLFALTMIHDLKLRSIDFVLAFPQAELHEDVYMELLFGFDQDGDRSCVMKLNKSIYGLKEASSD